MSKAVSLDLESLSLNPNAIILQIGAVVFEQEETNLFEELKFRNPIIDIAVSQDEQVSKFGRHYCSETAAWWEKQGLAKDMLFTRPGIMLDEAIGEFDFWLKNQMHQHGVDTLWVKGNRDSIWIEGAYEAVGMKFPIHYRNLICARSVGKTLGITCLGSPSAVPHDALSDAIVQAMWVQKIHSEINKWKRANYERNSQVPKMAA